MCGDFRDELTQSKHDFDVLISPVLPRLIKGKYTAVEGVGENVAKILDEQCGIDYIGEYDGKCFGIGMRIQPNEKYRTFTVRMNRTSGTNTEFSKRKTSIRNDFIYPTYTVHAYTDLKHERLIRMAAIKTKDLWQYIEKCNPNSRSTYNADFYYCEWDDIKSKGFDIKIFEEDKIQ